MPTSSPSTTRRCSTYLRTAWDEWAEAGLPDDPGQDRVVPYVFAHPGLTPHLTPTVPVATWARPGYFAYDTMTLVGPGTYEAARAAVDAALTAADLVAAGDAPAAYACTRPPGHHVTRTVHGGSCYLNNAAAAAAPPPGTHRRPGRGDRHRRPPRQRHPGDLLRPRRRAHRLGPRRPGRGVVPALPRLRHRDRGRRRRGGEPQRPARARARATPNGSRPSTTSAGSPRDAAPRPSSSPSASTPPPATPRARCR